MKIIFLDIDGVLNSRQHVIRLNRKGEFDPYRDEFCPVASSNLLYLLEQSPQSQIVVSSTWRLGRTVPQLKELLQTMCGVHPDRVIDKTPASLDRFRGGEINSWLKRKEVEQFVILDDDSDMFPHENKLVKTNNDLGLTILDVEKALNILNGVCEACSGDGREKPKEEGGFRMVCKVCSGKGYRNETVS